MKNAITGSNRICTTVAMLAMAAMLWVGSTQRGNAQTGRADAEDSSRSVPCSAAAVAGDWAYTETGAVFPTGVAVPFAAVARYTLEADGNLSGTATSSSGGTIANVTLKGTFTVNPDCTGTLTVGVYASGNLVRTASFDVVYVDGARGARGIVTSLVLVNGTIVPSVLTIDAEKVFKGPLHER
ncbi:MAG: hypothetical protein QOE55_5031 [Acidobacteriaceae bacterium]|jgi:hypothetical protein|nr:hypothetical protein [Acidobacteriaceae bacterium]